MKNNLKKKSVYTMQITSGQLQQKLNLKKIKNIFFALRKIVVCKRNYFINKVFHLLNNLGLRKRLPSKNFLLYFLDFYIYLNKILFNFKNF